MPYVCRVEFSGPSADEDGVDELLAGVDTAIGAGWNVPRVRETGFGGASPDDGTSESG